MRPLTLCAICAITASLHSCRPHKTLSTFDRSIAASYADTAMSATESVSHKANRVDTTKTTAAIEAAGIIEFVDAGGIVSIDSAGNLTLEGVKSIKGRSIGRLTQDKGAANNAETAATHTERRQSVKAAQSRHEAHAEEKAPEPMWHEKTLAKLSLGAFIAALLWAIWRYLRRKR